MRDVLVLWLAIASATPLAAQIDRSTIQALIDNGRYAEAARALDQAPATQTSRELRFDLERRRGDAGAAVKAWEALAATGLKDWDRLRALARDVAQPFRNEADPVLRIDACRALLGAGSPECVETLRTLSRDGSLPGVLRIDALKTVVRATGDARARNELQQLATSVATAEPSAAAAAAVEDADPEAAVTLLSAALAGASVIDKYQIAYLLGDAGARSAAAGKVAVQTLRNLLESVGPRGPAGTAAIVSLARLGDADAQKTLTTLLPALTGYDRVMAGVALASRRDQRGVGIIREAASASTGQLRVDAAVRLAQWDPSAAAGVLEAAAQGANPVETLAALQAWTRVDAEPGPAIRRALASSDQGLRLAAAVAVTHPFTEPRPPVRR